MPATTEIQIQQVIPYLVYDDAEAAIDFLTRALGFSERFRMPMPDGRIGHCELALGDSVLFLASAYPELGLTGPGETVHAQVLCYVEAVDAHYSQARQAGATVVGEPETQPHGDWTYRIVDPQGRRWIFSQHVKDVDPSEMETSAETGAAKP